MKIDISYFSQLDSTVPAEWQNKACGISSVKMLLDFYNKDSENKIHDLLREAELINAFDRNKNGGVWVHDGLVKIMRNHGLSAYVQEFRSVDVNLEKGEFAVGEKQKALMQRGVEKIMRQLKKGNPVIVSVAPDFGKNTDAHTIVLIGYEEDKNIETKEKSIKFSIHDPFDAENQTSTLSKFLKYWRKIAIFVD